MLLHRAIAFLGVIFLLSPAAMAEKRVVLVIGNGAYAKVGKLSNPTRDADAIEALFRKAGFDVVEAKRDLGFAAMHRALRDFSDRVRDADIAAVFFAGHGIEVNGTNYLIPVDATLERDTDVEVEAVSLDRVTQMLEHAKRLRLVILDACRDNPFMRSMKRTVASRSIGRGLAEVRVLTSDTLIAFAAKHGSTAADGEGTNSPYTTALVRHIATPGLDLRLALGRVRDEVLKSTTNRQEPHYYGSLGGAEVALVSAVTPHPLPAPAAKAPPVSAAAREWSGVDKRSVAELETFVRRHGTSAEADYARARIEELKKNQVSVAVPSARPQEPAAPNAPSARPTKKGQGGPGNDQIEAWRGAVQTSTYKMQSPFPVDQPIWRWSKTFVERLASLSGGKLKVEVVDKDSGWPSEQLDALSRGAFPLAWSIPNFAAQKSASLHIFSGQVPVGLTMEAFVRWLRARGEAQLNEVYRDRLNIGVRSIACAVSGPEGMWLKKPISAAGDLAGLRIRSASMPALVLQKLGARTEFLQAGGIIPAFEQGKLDGAEWADPLADEFIGLPRVASTYYYPSWHAPATLFDLKVSPATWSGWSDAHRALVTEACRQTLNLSEAAYKEAASSAIARMKAQGVRVHTFSAKFLDAVRVARDEVVRELLLKDPVFQTVWDGYISFK
jgi:TRAP-type mannitol/chloroaromatic compound transport system substrate-binding protein/uncharacterized caspase-like protein